MKMYPNLNHDEIRDKLIKIRIDDEIMQEYIVPCNIIMDGWNSVG